MSSCISQHNYYIYIYICILGRMSFIERSIHVTEEH